jgi:hypothetical protein
MEMSCCFPQQISPTRRERVADLGVNGYFQKPSDYIDFTKLKDVVKKLLLQ